VRFEDGWNGHAPDQVSIHSLSAHQKPFAHGHAWGLSHADVEMAWLIFAPRLYHSSSQASMHMIMHGGSHMQVLKWHGYFLHQGFIKARHKQARIEFAIRLYLSQGSTHRVGVATHHYNLSQAFPLAVRQQSFLFVSELMDLLLTGEDQSQANQPNNLAEGHPM